MRFIEKKKVRVGKIKKTEDGEWMVPVYVDGKFNDDMTYYAGEGAEAKKDAEGTRDQIIKDMKDSKEYEFTEEVEVNPVLTIDEEVEIKQGEEVLILEKGDKVKVFKKLEEDDNFIYMTLVGMQGKNIGCTMFLKSLNMNVSFLVKRATVDWDKEDNRIYVMGTNSSESFVISPSKVKVSAGGSSSINLIFTDGSGNMTLSKE